MEPVQRHDAAAFRIEPVQFGALARRGHGEQAHTVGPQQQIGRQLHRLPCHAVPEVLPWSHNGGLMRHPP